MLKSLFVVPSGFVQDFRLVNRYSYSLLRLLHNGKLSDSTDEEEKKEQFNGPIPVEFLKIKYSRSPGPGGQNVNKVNTKVDVRFHVMSAQWIPYWMREKLLQEESNRINKEGELVVQSSQFRNQRKNLMDAVEKVREILENVSIIPNETSDEKKAKISEFIKSQHERRLKEKKFRSQRKQDRSSKE